MGVSTFLIYYFLSPFHSAIVRDLSTISGNNLIAIGLIFIAIPGSIIYITIGICFLIHKGLSQYPDQDYNSLLRPIIIAGYISVIFATIFVLMSFHTPLPSPLENLGAPTRYDGIAASTTVFLGLLGFKHLFGQKISLFRFSQRIWPTNTDSSSSQTSQAEKQPGKPHTQRQPHNQTQNTSNHHSSQGEFEYPWSHDTSTSFSDVGGMDDLIDTLQREVIKPFQEVERARKLGIKPPNVLFYGPPGTGKTHMAEALAGELNFPFVKLSGSNVTTKWINESSARINQLFTEAKTIAASEGGAVIFVDELDSILSDRSSGSESHGEDTKVVNELLNHLEESTTYGVVFIGATNRIDALDKAGIRSGRIDKQIEIGKPDLKAREEILSQLLMERDHRVTVDKLHETAQQTEGLVAADIELLVRKAATNVFTRGKSNVITNEDIDTALSEMDI